MTFKTIAEQTNDVGVALTWMFNGFEAIDLERNLVIITTNGRTRGARRWFIYRFNPENNKREWDYDSSDRVCFRAWNLREALERTQEKRIANRIQKLVQP